MLNPIEETFETKTFAAPNMIVMATDLTDTEELLPHAIAQAKASNAALRFVYAIPPYETFVPEAGKVAYIDPAERARDARMVLEQLAKQVSAQGINCAVTVRCGEPADIVAELVKETGAQRVIVRTHWSKAAVPGFNGSRDSDQDRCTGLHDRATLPAAVQGWRSHDYASYCARVRLLHKWAARARSGRVSPCRADNVARGKPRYRYRAVSGPALRFRETGIDVAVGV